MINGLDLFSGIGGITLALSPWVNPVAYCENDRYAQSVILSRMANGELPVAPIWDDIRTLTGTRVPAIDMVYGGFPCQDISVAGAGKGLDGDRSGLFFEIVRIVEETKPAFVFLENVAAIRTRGLSRVVRELARLGFDLRWTTISAAEVGAPHLRKRWFLLAAHPDGLGVRELRRWSSRALRKSSAKFIEHGPRGPLADTDCSRESQCSKEWDLERDGTVDCGEVVADASSVGRSPRRTQPEGISGRTGSSCCCGSMENSVRSGRDAARAERSAETNRTGTCSLFARSDWWTTEPALDRVVNGLPNRMDRIKCLGNSVVPLQARTAFERLMGIET